MSRAPLNPKAAGPIVIASWPKNTRETFRVTLDNYKGCPILDFRVWWNPSDGAELRPGKTGVTCAAWHVEKIAEAFAAAVAEARKQGLLEVRGDDQ